jgi:hypothetical protein
VQDERRGLGQRSDDSGGQTKRFLVNEHQRLICTRNWCGLGLELGGMEKHSIKTHEVEKKLARGVQNGLGSQKGLAVFDGFQCRLCEEC